MTDRKPKKHGEIWITEKRQILGILWSRTKRSKIQYNKDAGKEIILLNYTSTMTPTPPGERDITGGGGGGAKFLGHRIEGSK